MTVECYRCHTHVEDLAAHKRRCLQRCYDCQEMVADLQKHKEHCGAKVFFFHCPADTCNRKYKTELKLRDHAIETHKLALSDDLIAATRGAWAPDVANAVRETQVREKETAIRATAARVDAQTTAEAVAAKKLALLNDAKFEKLRALVLNRPGDDFCKICWDRMPDYANSACGHKYFCKECLEVQPRCPMCSVPVRTIIKIYS